MDQAAVASRYRAAGSSAGISRTLEEGQLAAHGIFLQGLSFAYSD
jgi:hypothetical protein